MAVWWKRLNLPANIRLNFVAIPQTTAEGHSDNTVSDRAVPTKQLPPHGEMAPIDVH